MKKISIAFWILLTAAVVNAQGYKIVKAWAFKTVSTPGMAMKDDNGNTINPQPVIERFIYIETNCKTTPKIDTVLYDSIYFKATLTFIKQAKQLAGVIYEDAKAVYISPKKGNKLWRIDLKPLNEKLLPGEIVKNITIKGKLGSVRFKQTLTAETRLSGPEYQ